jgi:hypothetical protein
MKIYLGESDNFNGIPAYKAVVHYLREQGIWGATVTRGVYGFGKRSTLHSSSPLRLSEDLPIIIDVVDSKKKIMGLIPHLSEMIKGGLITTEDVKILRHIGDSS